MPEHHPNFKDLSGQRFGTLVALSYAPIGRHSAWLCRCDCGREKIKRTANLKHRPYLVCRCLHKYAERGPTHSQWKGGVTFDTSYGIFRTLLQRCSNPASKKYRLYGAVGIECKFENFEQFRKELGPRPSSKHTVDRIDPFGHYERGNVRWATHHVQQGNKRPRRLSFAITREDYFGFVKAPLSFGV